MWFNSNSSWSLAVFFGLVAFSSNQLFSQDEVQPESSSLISFASDVWPILQEHCLECHGSEKAKNDFRVDEEVSFMTYIEPGSVDNSSLWTDYLTTDDPDMKMPPIDSPHATGMSGAKLAVLKTWIEEGAKWETPPTLMASESTEDLGADVSSLPLANRIWIFQGLFHPASVHFPIALLLISSVFFLGSFVWRKTFEPVAFHCLWVGAVASIASCVMGWAYAQHEGYGPGFTFNLQKSAIDRHRWLGIVVSAIALGMIPVAYTVRKNRNINGRIVWTMGSLLLLVGVSLVGYQGGELVYGEGHYEKEFERLFKSSTKVPAVTTDSTLDEVDLNVDAANDDSLMELESEAAVGSDTSEIDADSVLEEGGASDSSVEMQGEDAREVPTSEDTRTSSKVPAKSSEFDPSTDSEVSAETGLKQPDTKSNAAREMAF